LPENAARISKVSQITVCVMSAILIIKIGFQKADFGVCSAKGSANTKIGFTIRTASVMFVMSCV
jgi:hypothetical protein